MRNTRQTEQPFYGMPAWGRVPAWRRFVTRYWFAVVLLIWVILFSACAGDGRPGDVEPRLDVDVHVINNNWLEVTVYAWINNLRTRLGNVSTGNEETFTLPRAIADHPDLRFLIDPIGSTATHLTQRVLVGAGGVIRITVENNLLFTAVIVR